MSDSVQVDAIAHAIQLAVTPVFLLAGVGAMLSVLANRLARIVDRGRVLHDRRHHDQSELRDIDSELAVINRRMRVVNTAISLCTLCALLICTVVAVLFFNTITASGNASGIALLFIAAMTCLIGALLAFLVEIYLATVKVPLRR
ncbi:MAG: DUF2721 domain-containing protein [Gammaproteobacteria bacterium]|nr:DUF2721 domain-containing protein [Gammaproteobacteria bacterium]